MVATQVIKHGKSSDVFPQQGHYWNYKFVATDLFKNILIAMIVPTLTHISMISGMPGE